MVVTATSVCFIFTITMKVVSNVGFQLNNLNKDLAIQVFNDGIPSGDVQEYICTWSDWIYAESRTRRVIFEAFFHTAVLSLTSLSERLSYCTLLRLF